MKRKSFKKRVAELYEHFRPDLKCLPTAEDILAGDASAPDDMTFDQTFELSHLIVDRLHQYWIEYDYEPNILLEAKNKRFIAYLDKLQPELQLFFHKKAHNLGILNF